MIYFKFPFKPGIYTIESSAENNAVKFVSFDEKKVVDFPGEIKEISKEELLEKELLINNSDYHSFESKKEEEKENYQNKISEVIQFIKDENLKKLVISRRKVLHYQDISQNKNISLTKTFLNLCESYPNAFVYLFKKETVWMGAFSELLGKFNKNNSEFETMSLAGTLPVNEEWTKKEIEEQKPVTDYILNILKRYSENVEKSKTYDHISGNIKHLRTDFNAKIEEKELENLIAELHPTPAVCGIPKDFCRTAIERFEGYNRELYAGYIRIETQDEILYFVNLRCAEFTENRAFLFVGGGITAQSNPEKEWRETELKSEAILKNIAIF